MRIVFFSILVLCLYQSNAQKEHDKKIIELSDKVESKVIAWRRDLHEHPELGNREFRTADIIARHLQELGIEVTKGVGKTGVVGILKGDKAGPVIALRADMDALPVTERTNVPFASKVVAKFNGQDVGVMHACGHDAHVAILMGVAEVLAGMRKEINGTVKFIFQPAEEGAPFGEEGGAELMIKEKVLENPKVDVIFGLHLDAQLEAGKIGYRPGGTYASVNDLKIKIKGRSSHGAAPWNGTDPIVVSAEIINALQTIVSRNLNISENGGVVTIGTIHAGNRSNIIPEEAEMTGTIRAMSKHDEVLLVSRVREIATKTAEALGAEAEVHIPYSSHYPITFNDSSLTYSMLPSLEKSAGKENVLLRSPKTVAEDFSFYGEKVPALFFNLGSMPKGKDPKTAADHHTPDFYVEESGLKLGVVAFTNLVFDYLKAHSSQKKQF